MARNDDVGVRNNMFMLRLTDQEEKWLRELSTMTGLAKADIVRLAIRRAHREQTEDPPHRTVQRHSKKRARNDLGADGVALLKASARERISLVRKPK